MAYNVPPTRGLAAVTDAAPVTLPSINIVGPAKTGATNTYDFISNTNGWYDALGYAWASYTIVVSALTTAATVQFETTNDITSAPNGVTMPVVDSAVAVPTARITSFVLTSSTTRIFDGPITGRYIRLRPLTSVSSGTVTVSVTLQQSPPPIQTQFALMNAAIPVGASTLGTVSYTPWTTGIIGSHVVSVNQASDVATGNISTTFTTTTKTLTSGAGTTSSSFWIPVNTVTGTNPTLDVAVLESYDDSLYVPLYHFERITATGVYSSPNLTITGMYLRYAFTVSGTSPVFNLSVQRVQRSAQGTNMRQYWDRTLNPNTLNSATPAFPAFGASQVHLSVASGTATSYAIIRLEASVDGSSWHTLTTLTTSGNQVVQTTRAIGGSWVRAIVSTAGSGQTLNNICITTLGMG